MSGDQTEGQVMGNTENKQNQRERRRQAGLCTECGKQPLLEGRQICAVCADYKTRYNTQRSREQRARWKAEGRCSQCGRPRDGWTLCDRCRRHQREKMQARRDAMRLAGCCMHCGVLVEGGRSCPACRAKRRAYYRGDA